MPPVTKLSSTGCACAGKLHQGISLLAASPTIQTLRASRSKTSCAVLFSICLDLPQIKSVLPPRRILDLFSLDRLPVAHIEIVRYHARARFHLLPNVRADH